MPNNIINQNEIISKKLAKWNRVTTLLNQDEEEIKNNFAKQFPNEPDKAFEDRKKYYVETFINMTHDLVSAPVNSLFRQAIENNYEKKDKSMLYSFHQNVTLGREKVPFLRYLKDYIAIGLRSYGNVFTVIDKPRGIQVSKLAERERGRPYISNIVPQDVLDWQYGDDGELLWFAYKRTYSPIWPDPFKADMPETQQIQCLWTRDRFEVRNENGETLPALSFDHGYGFVPVIIQASFLTKPNDVIGQAAMDQTSNWIITIGSLFNLLVHELYKHGGSLLAIQEGSILPENFKIDSDGETEIKKQDRGSAMVYAGDKIPEYILKDLATEDIMKVAQYYIQMATENERDMKSVIKRGTGDSDVSQSGVAKMIDREPLESTLVALAEDVEIYSQKVNDKAALLMNEKNDYTLEFDKDFDFRTVKEKFDEIAIAQKDGVERMSSTLHKEMWINLVGDITRDPERQEECIEEIKNAEDEDLMLDESIKKIVDGDFSNKFNKDKPIKKEEKKEK